WSHGVDHALEGQSAGGSRDSAAGGKRPARGDQAVRLFLQRGTGGARDDARHAAAVREVAVRGVDDRVDRLFQAVAANHQEATAGRYFFLREDFRRLGTFAPARRASDRPMAMACLRLFTRLPERPLFSVPRLRSCIARLTLERAFLPYLAIDHSTLAFALSTRINSSTRCCASCCWMRCFTSASPGKRIGRTSSSWITW